MITKATFKCDQCAKKKTVSIPTKRGKNVPTGWFTLRGVGFRVDVCSEKCRRLYSVAHAIGHSESEDRPGPRLVKVGGIPEGLRGLFEALENSDQAMSSALKDLAKEFGVPVEVVQEFATHVRSVPCPKCQAEEGDHCEVQPGDVQRNCPLHGPELTVYAHSERIAAAKATWRSKTQ